AEHRTPNTEHRTPNTGPSRSLRDRLTLQQVVERPGGAGGGHAPLPARVPVADRDRAVGQALAIDRDAERRAGLVLPPIPPADRPFLIIEDILMPFQLAVNRLGPLGHPVALHQGEDR